MIPAIYKGIRTNMLLSKKCVFSSLLLFYFIIFSTTVLLKAEGSVDFVNNDGYRLFLDTRDNQSMKVYANEGEYLNLASSHIGIEGGYIDVYRPDGTLHFRFDNTGENAGEGIINNLAEEVAGPIGYSNGGYDPNVVQVGPGQSGIWTIVFDYPGQTNDPVVNILNNASWTRDVYQPMSQRIVVAWDITVSQNSSANQGGNMLTGRVYSTKYVVEIYGNGFTTSPTFYVLSKDGFTYEVNYNEVDPYRFTIGSNSFGITDHDQAPVYHSVAVGEYIVSQDPETWVTPNLYLYQLNAEDSNALINNKVFFNIPANDLPPTGQVTDIYDLNGPNTYITWLKNIPNFNPVINFSNFEFVGHNDEGVECDPNAGQTGIGGNVIFETNLGGTVTLQLDLNNDGDYNDDIDRLIFNFVEEGIDTIFWDGKDGLGQDLPIGNGYTIGYNISIKGGEIHIPLIDIENNTGGVEFNLINELGQPEETGFYYDHSTVGGTISGDDPSGIPDTTTTPYTWDSNFGDSKILDFWTYLPFSGDGSGIFTFDISDDCICGDTGTPQISFLQTEYSDCEGNALTLTANNAIENLDTIFYTFSNANGILGYDTIVNNSNGIASIEIASPNISHNGVISVIATTQRGCMSETAQSTISLSPLPQIGSITTNTDENGVCSGTSIDINIPISNISNPYTYIISNSDGQISSGNSSDTNLQLNYTNLTTSGQYSFSINSEGCEVSDTFDITIHPIPQNNNFTSDAPSIICAGTEVVLTASSNMPSNFSLIIPDGTEINGIINEENLFSYAISQFNSESDGSYQLTFTSVHNCISETSTITLSEPHSTPAISLLGEGLYCDGDNVTLTASNSTSNTGVITYNWTGPNINFSESIGSDFTSAVNIPNFSSVNEGNYTLTSQSACGADSIISFMLTGVESFEFSNVTPSLETCNGDSLYLFANSNLSPTISVTYTWTGPDFSFTSTAPGSGPFTATIPSISALDQGNYNLSLDTNEFNCEISEANLSVVVNQSPMLDMLTGSDTYCQLDPIELSAINSNNNVINIDYTWIAPDGTEFINSVAGDQPLLIVIEDTNEAFTGQWALVASSQSGCSADTAFVDVILDPAPVIFGLGDGIINQCEGTDVTIVANNGNPNIPQVFWEWKKNDITLFYGTSDSTDEFTFTIPTITEEDEGEYILILSGENECPSGVGSVTISIIDTPSIINIEGGGLACPNSDITLLANLNLNGLDEIDFTWEGPNEFELSGTTLSNTVTLNLTDIQEDQAGIYTLFIEGGECKTEPLSIEIEVSETPIVTLQSNFKFACPGEDVILTATPLENANYTFNYLEDGEIIESIQDGSNNQLTISPFNFNDQGEYNVVVIDDCDNEITSQTIEISTIGANLDAIDDNGTTQENEQLEIPINSNDETIDNVIYSIITDPQNGSAEILSDLTLFYTPNEEFFGVDSLQYQICSHVCEDFCSTAWVIINVEEEVIVEPPVEPEECFLPNYFSPNDDSHNQSFYINCLEDQFTNNELKIYNRWGDEVFYAKPYMNDWQGTREGEDLPAGTYFYLLDFDLDGDNKTQGYITILK